MTKRKKSPKGWRWEQLSELIDDSLSGFGTSKRDPNGPIQFRPNNVGADGDIDTEKLLRVPCSEKHLFTHCLEAGDVLFNNTNSRDLVGKSAIFEGYSEPVVFSNHITRLRVKKGRLDAYYLAFWLRDEWGKGTFKELCNRWVGQVGVNWEKLGQSRIPLPPNFEEQERIVEVLRQADAVRRKRAEARRLADQIISSTFRKYFGAVEVKQEPLGSLLISTPQYGTSERANSLGDGYPVLRIPNVLSGQLDNSDLKFVPGLTDKQKKKWLVSSGDILLVRTNGNRDYVGRCCVVPDDLGKDVVFASYLMRLRPDPDQVLSEYLDAFLRTEEARTQMLRTIPTSAGNYNINAKNLSAITIPIPAKDIQQRFVHIIEQHRIYSARSLQSETEQNALFNVLLSRAFTGELTAEQEREAE